MYNNVVKKYIQKLYRYEQLNRRYPDIFNSFSGFTVGLRSDAVAIWYFSKINPCECVRAVVSYEDSETLCRIVDLLEKYKNADYFKHLEELEIIIDYE